MSTQKSSSAASSQQKGPGLAIASLVLGILSLCGSGVFVCGGILSLVGIVLGALGLNSRGRGMAIAGIILSVVGLLLAIVTRVIFRGVLFNNYFQNLFQQFLNSRGY
jgi:hypothetical protein